MSYKVMDSGFVAEDGFDTVEDAQDFSEGLMASDNEMRDIHIVDEKTKKVVCKLTKYRVIIEWTDVKDGEEQS